MVKGDIFFFETKGVYIEKSINVTLQILQHFFNYQITELSGSHQIFFIELHLQMILIFIMLSNNRESIKNQPYLDSDLSVKQSLWVQRIYDMPKFLFHVNTVGIHYKGEYQRMRLLGCSLPKHFMQLNSQYLF